MAKLKPAFVKPYGTVTAANSSFLVNQCSLCFMCLPVTFMFVYLSLFFFWRERNHLQTIDSLFHPFMDSSVESYMCPDRESNVAHWDDNPTKSYPARAYICVLSIEKPKVGLSACMSNRGLKDIH